MDKKNVMYKSIPLFKTQTNTTFHWNDLQKVNVKKQNKTVSYLFFIVTLYFIIIEDLRFKRIYVQYFPK